MKGISEPVTPVRLYKHDDLAGFSCIGICTPSMFTIRDESPMNYASCLDEAAQIMK